MDNKAKDIYICPICFLTIRRKNKARHERESGRHQNAQKIKDNGFIHIEDVFKQEPVKNNIATPRGSECSKVSGDNSSIIRTDNGSNTSVYGYGDIPNNIIQPMYYPRYNLHYDPDNDIVDRFAINSNFYNTNRT